MGKPLQFRVWANSEKKMLYSSEDFAIDMNGKVLFKVESNEYDYMPKKFEDDYIVQNYVGVKDCNGKQIFEGDIVKGMMHFGPAGLAEKVCEIRYKDAIEGYQLHYWNIYTLEVIGNIFENKYLLDEYGDS